MMMMMMMMMMMKHFGAKTTRLSFRRFQEFQDNRPDIPENRIAMFLCETPNR